MDDSYLISQINQSWDHTIGHELSGSVSQVFVLLAEGSEFNPWWVPW